VRILWALLHRHASVPCALPHGHGCKKMGGDTGRCSSHLDQDGLDSITRRHRAPFPIPHSGLCLSSCCNSSSSRLLTCSFPSPPHIPSCALI